MFNIDYINPNVNCTVYCIDALTSAGLTDEELKQRAEELNESGERILLRQLDYDCYGDVEIYLEYEGMKENWRTKKAEKTYRFIKKAYANCTYTSYSEEFTLHEE